MTDTRVPKMVTYPGKFFSNPLVDTALALWNNLWDMTAINEVHYGNSEPSVQYVLPYGDWKTRGRKAQDVLFNFYLVYFGEQGKEIAETFLKAMRTWQWASTSLRGINDSDPRLAKADADYAAAQTAIDGLLDGVRVTGRCIKVPEGHPSLSHALATND